MPATYVVGIDLGTTHCAVAASPIARAAVDTLPLPQLVAPGEVAARELLPSFLYLPAPGEFADTDLALPWAASDAAAPDTAAPIVGELARQRGAQVPGRLVASAKSWICHGGVNRRAPILPWSAPDGEPHISPYKAQVRLLEHLRRAWDAARPPLAEQEVVVTVPASFDEVARELTTDAAREAGLPTVRLVEEPQAALYDFLGAHPDDLADALADARLVLVIDVGGGTTDLTLVRVHPATDGEPPTLDRIAVGGHLMLGGDNMDAALAHHVLTEANINRRLDPTEWAALVQSARRAKEQLLAAEAPADARVSVQRRGARLIGGTRTVTLKRDAVQTLLLDGFCPHTGPAEVADRRGRAGLTTLGLPYTADAGIPRHVNAFLRRHVDAAREAGATIHDGLPRPDRVLLNGGVFNAPALVERLQAVISGWYGAPVPLLAHTSLDTAVARGAARFALGRRGIGHVIGGGTARAYYVGVEGPDARRQALCVAPKGMDDGSTVDVDRQFSLRVDRPVAFPLYAYTGARTDPAGAIIEVAEHDDLDRLPPIETVLRRQGDMWVDPQTGGVPVRLTAALTQNGDLELSLGTIELPPRRWKLAFDVGVPEPTAQPDAAPPEPEEAPREALPLRFNEARRAIEKAYGPGRIGHDPKNAKGLRRDLEGILGGRGQWSSTVCRALFDALWSRRDHRGTTDQHELNWLRLASWCIRPGFGAHGDRDRIDTLWTLHAQGLAHPKSKATWGEWWILWRRAAAGLDAARQRALFEDVRPWLAPPKGPPPKGPRAHGHPEMIRLLAALERLSPADKETAGAWFDAWFGKIRSWWPLGRLGARIPFNGDPADAVPAAVAERWLDRLMPLDWQTEDGADFAAVMLARVTGDPARDVDPARRRAVADRLAAIGASHHWIEMVSKATTLTDGDARRVFGDSLPAGLRIA